MRQQNPELLLVDAGGAFPAAKSRSEGDVSVLVAAMDLMGYDAMNVGGDEARTGVEYLQSQQQQVAFPLLSANSIESDTGGHPFAAYILESAGDIQVAVIGLVAVEADDTAVLSIEEPVEALRRVLQQISGQAQVVVVLAYMSVEDAADLAEQVPDLDVIIVTSEGQLIQQPKTVNGALIIQPGDQGKYVGNLSFAADALGRLRNVRNEIVILDETYEDDLQVNALLQSLWLSQ